MTFIDHVSLLKMFDIEFHSFIVVKTDCPAKLVPVGDFTIQYQNNSEPQVNFALRSDTKIQWPGGTPPKDSPECGFENELCSPDDSSKEAESGKANKINLNQIYSVQNV